MPVLTENNITIQPKSEITAADTRMMSQSEYRNMSMTAKVGLILRNIPEETEKSASPSDY